MTLTQLLAFIAYDFKRTDKTTETTQFINDAIYDIATRIPHSAYKYQSYSPTVSGQEDYPLPSTVIHLLHPIRFLEGTGSADSGWALDFLTKQEYDDYEINPNRTSPGTGDPLRYTVFSGSILLSPIPDSSSNYLEIDWTKRPTTLSSGSDSPALGAEYDEVIKQMVMHRLFRSVEMYQEADYWRSLYEDARGTPVGLLGRLLDIERDKEDLTIDTVSVNEL